MKTTYTGILKGKPTTVTFESDQPQVKLSRFCTRTGADITTFKLKKQTK